MAFFGFGKRSSKETWIIAGLGNYGDKYKDSRHNAGFVAADSIAETRGISFKHHKCHAAVARYDIEGKSVILVKPLTYMNRSGEAISALLKFYKVTVDHLIVIYDDIDIAEGALRVREKGGPGTHNGMRNIVSCLGEDGFPRIRVGVGSPPHGGDLVKYVLGNMGDASREAAKKGALAAEAIVSRDIEFAMREFNSKG